MLKFESDTVTGLGPGTRANILAQRSRSQRFWQENKERRQIRLEQRAAAETYRREQEAKRDRRDDPVQRRVAARQQAVAKAKRRLKKAPRPVVTTTQKKPSALLTSEERIALQKWRHRETAIEREQRELDERRQIRASEELVRKSWEQETAPKKVANPSLFSLDDAMAVVAPAFVREEASPTRLEEHTEHAVAISSILKPKDPVPLKKTIATKLAESPERVRPAGGGVAAARTLTNPSRASAELAVGGVAAARRTLTNPYKPKPRAPAPEARYEAAAAYSGSRPGMVFKKGDRGVGYYEDPLAPRVLMPTEPTAEPDSEADAADDSDAVLERLKAKLRQDVDAAAALPEDAPVPEKPSEAEFLRALAAADAAADAAAPTDAAEPSPIAEHAPGSSPIDALAAAFASAASPSLVTAPGSELRVTTDDADDLPDSEVRLRAAEDAAEEALSRFDAAPLTGKADAFRSALAAAEAELDEALATARSSTSGPAEALAGGVDEDAYLVDEGGDASDADGADEAYHD